MHGRRMMCSCASITTRDWGVSDFDSLLSVCLATHVKSFLDGLPYLSNFYGPPAEPEASRSC